MRGEEVYDTLLHGESQTVEFKSSLAEEREAIQTMVAFANSQGGWVFFGVNNDGMAKGVHVGKNTLENLAAAIRDHTYPSLPVVIEEPFPYGGKNILSVEVPADVPPVIGLYLYCDEVIPLHSPVDAGRLQAYRRVGRMNQKEDFMRLRRAMPSDPRVRVALLEQQQLMGPGREPNREGLGCRVWVEEGSATAHHVSFRLQPSIAGCDYVCDDLPYPYDRRGVSPAVGFIPLRSFRFFLGDIPQPVPPTLQLIASYKDDWGLTWESSRRLDLVPDPLRDEEVYVLDGGEFSRRIVAFPPKG
jgi:hypothetical protein